MGKAVNSKDTHNIDEHDKEESYYTTDYLQVYLQNMFTASMSPN